MVISYSPGDELTDGSGVPLRHIFFGFKRRGSFHKRVLWQGEHLVEITIKGDEVFLDESISGTEVFIERNPQESTDLIVAVIGKAPAVCYQYQKQVEQQFIMGETLKKAIS
jgi:hypothetical protein